MPGYRTKNPVKDSGTDMTDPGDVLGDWAGYAGFGVIAGSALLAGLAIARRINSRGRSFLQTGSTSGSMWDDV